MRLNKPVSVLGQCVALMSILFFPSAQAEQPIHHVSSETCKTCHKEIYSQWKSSMHAQSSALEDPIHATFYGMVIGDPRKEGQKSGKGTYPVCLQCHAPNAAKDKTTKLDANVAYAEGVNCVVCHTLEKFNGTTGANGKPTLGLKAYKTSTSLQGPMGFKTEFKQEDDLFGDIGGSDSDKPNPHLGASVEMDGKTIPSMPMQGNPTLMKTNDACMGCHDKRGNSHGVPLCRTGDEYAEGGADVTCTSCHMPIAGGLADHSMGGGHDNAMLERGVVFSLTADAQGGTLKTVARLQNKQPHSLPTGAPFRNIYMILTAYDESGNVLWQNTKGHPINDDPQAYFNYELLDDKGMHTSPPKAKSVGPDNRLKAFETRELTYDIPAKGVALVRGELFYNLLWPELAKKFSKKLPENLTAPQSIAFAEVKL
jgi:nitrate/TMAO reductase-like tetraheme cytochrome c subunit